MAFGVNDQVVNEEEEEQQQPLVTFGTQDKVIEEAPPPVTTPVFGKQDTVVEDTPAVEPQYSEPDPRPLEIPETSFKDLTKEENLNIIRNYAVARFGESGKQEEGESNEDYVKRWMSAMRLTDWNTTLDGVSELNWIYNSKEEDVAKAAEAWRLYESVPAFFSKGGQDGVRPLGEIFMAILSDPLTAATAGIGKLAGKAAGNAAIKVALKEKLKTVGKYAAYGAAFDATTGAAQSAVVQQREIELGLRDEFSNTEMVLSGALNSLGGAVESGSMAYKAVRKPKKSELEEVLKSRTPTPVSKEQKSFKEAWDAELEQTLTEFDKFEGRQTLDKLSPPTDITEAQVKKDLNLKAINVARYILEEDPNFRETLFRVANKEQRISDAVKDVFMVIEQRTKQGDVDVPTIDDAMFEAALEKAGINLKEFAEAARTTVADGASIMQGYSAAARIIRRTTEIDPEAKKIIDRMYGRDQEVPSAFGWFGNGIRRLERESKAFVVSSIGTTMRNMMGTSVGLGFDAAKQLVNSSMYAVGKTIKGTVDVVVRGKTYEKGSITKGLSDIVKDSFNTLTYLTNAGVTSEVTDAILKYNPRIKSQIFHALQESSASELSAAARFANSFNVAQDVLFRQAIFTASIERQMRRAGMDMYQVLADNKRIPTDVVKNAADEALKGTFSFMPKKGLANNFVRFFEAPGMSLINPFPRFMVNAIAFQMKYNPITAGAKAASDIVRSKLAKDPVVAERLGARAMDEMSNGIIGGAAILAAYQYRTEHSDLKFFELENADGSVVDTRAIFPIGPYLAMGELARNIFGGTFSEVRVKETLETLAGMKIPSGTQFTFLENLPELAEGILSGLEGKEAEKAKAAVGKFVGDFITRFFQPFQPLTEYIKTFDKEMSTAKDPNVTEGEDVFSENLLNRIKSKLPAEVIPGMEPLPEAVQPFREGAPVRAGEFFNVLTGIRARPAANRLEEEVKNLNIEPYTFYPSSGIREYDREVMKKALPYIEDMVIEKLDDPEYQSMSLYEKRIAFKTIMREAIGYGREEAKEGLFDTEEQEMMYHKMVFNRLPADERRILNAAYAREHDGRTIEQDKAYDMHYDYVPDLEMLKQ